MNSDPYPDLSRSEFDILRVLWKNGALSVREVHDLVSEKTSWAYTTTKTMMDRMAGKGLLKREEFHRIFLYRPQITRVQGLLKWVRFMAERVFEADPVTVVDRQTKLVKIILLSLFGENNSLSSEEIEELKSLLRKEGNSK